MLFDRSLRRDLARSFGATLVVLLTIVITMLLVRTLSLAPDVIQPDDVVLVLGYTTLSHLPTILNVSVFAAIVVTFGRMYRDSEMAIWFASGLKLARFVRPVLLAFWPVMLVVCLLLLFAWPWVNRTSGELRDRYAQRSDLSRVAPGVFQTSADGQRVFFVERDADTEMSVRNIFALSNKDELESVVSARSGRLEMEGNDRFLVLESGQRSDINARNGESTLAGFESYRVLVDIKSLRRLQEPPARTLDTIVLLREPTLKNQGELVWRFGLMMAGVNLCLLAIGLAHVNTRRPTNWNLVFALLGSLSYFNAISLSQTWVASGRYGMTAAFATLHGGVFLLAMLLLWWRDHAAVLHFRMRSSRRGKA